ncbi:DNA-directed RNA polymerase II subunit, putative [Entamoeba histolytica HM-1:IMSS-B]|uniref:DNA-directed RNA polymerase II subunit, putative n=5 Tax=Entamoeba histolytica TaxID=5759 RepID=C4LXI3_ENTH1|nr:DNA-directed RNA polymerase II subunit, putative [Entamoeba histolytica HM-1:IMSS]EMD43146.1 DNA-directed RNA polymerase II subunit, putative [Entamoeba histolytica KU27]EMH73043.1 DNA-directed RNA polymerase II subunit, putative [Entamoeba histolytica HM-1:IMSS-B]ENY60750.1 DNA-directed RNA polymerase II subunit, putative [Entamoeba histolytica HM-1:IMSS-A]GAT93462.1 DNA-directed RNA polymerase II subunit putative [Entamoeba histolytica]EAL50138.2 DNA-directed RNA polymerase II subunit, pu|eukprot:XP_655527.2 DNA-directed RNA polymerase II subunit, putative [Entamoeba histolytica HM-1:IMSS]
MIESCSSRFFTLSFLILSYTIQVTPEHLNGGIEDYLDKYISETTGYNKDYECIVICVLNVLEHKPIRIAEGTGNVVFSVKFEAIVQKIIRSEVVDGIISSVNKEGVTVDVGSWKNIHVTASKVADCEYVEQSGCYRDKDRTSQYQIRKGSHVRVRSDVVDYNINGKKCLGTIERSFSSHD